MHFGCSYAMIRFKLVFVCRASALSLVAKLVVLVFVLVLVLVLVFVCELLT